MCSCRLAVREPPDQGTLRYVNAGLKLNNGMHELPALRVTGDPAAADMWLST